MTEGELSESSMFDQYSASTLHWSGLQAEAESIAAYVAALSEAEQNRRKHFFAEAKAAYMVFGDWRVGLVEDFVREFLPRMCDSLVNVFISMDNGAATVEARRASERGKHERAQAGKEKKGGIRYARTRRGPRS